MQFRRRRSLLSRLSGPALCAALVWMGLFFAGATTAAQAQDRASVQAVGMLPVDEVSPRVLREARAAVMGPDRTGKEGPMARLGMELALLYHQNRAVGTSGVQALRNPAAPSAAAPAKAARPGAPRPRSYGRVRSPISEDGRFVAVDAVAAAEPSRLLADLENLGLRHSATAGNVVSGRLPVSALRDAAALASLRSMMPVYARTHVGEAQSEADSSNWAIDAREDFGVDGGGEKVCALSDSYDQAAAAATSAADDVASGDLPGAANPVGNTDPVDVVQDNDSEGTDEGRAMLQLIHDIAPGARLGFHTATVGGLAGFASGIQDLADAGCTVIVDDIRYNTEPFYQDGPVSNTVDDVVAQGIPYFSSAGNDGQNTYEAPFRNSGEPGVVSETYVAHDFDPGGAVDTRQALSIAPDGTFQIFSFQWTDPSAQVEGSSGPDTDIDIALVDQDGNIVAESIGSNASVPVESLEYTNDGNSEVTLNLVVEKAPADPAPDEIKYVYSGSGFTIEEYDTGGPTIYGHPMAEGAMAVAAAPFFNTARYNPGIDSSAILEYFSSKGGLQIRFDQNGNELSSPRPREKPDVTGTDFVDNTFFGTDIGLRDPDDFPNFSGTSAAAPNVAAIGALMRQADPALTPVQIYDRLESTAIDVRFRQQLENGSISNELDPTGEGVDPWSGHGFVRADRAVPAPAGVRISDVRAEQVSPGARSINVSWRKAGVDTVDAFRLERRYFDEGVAERETVPAGPETEFRRTVENLPVGEHKFVILALQGDNVVARDSVSAVLRGEGPNASVYPNPFGADARLSVTLPQMRTGEETITVKVFDILGRHVATPIRNKELRTSGATAFDLNAVRSLGSGVYFFRVEGDTFTTTTKAVRVR
mgnify:FL=1